MRVALVVMPFAAADRPSLGAGLLQAGLAARGIACDTKHFNVTLRRMMGNGYDWFAGHVSVAALAGEWAFSQALWGERASTWERYEREVLDVPIWGMRAEDRPRVRALRELAPAFLRVAFESNDWGAYDLVGFTSTFEQTVPGLCLAKMIRERWPHVRVALGGANFEAGMGRPYIEQLPFVDYVSTGEADVSFPLLCERLRDGSIEELGVPGGFFHRVDGEVREAPRGPGTSPRSLDALPVPEYGDYFRVAGATFAGERRVTWLPIEASRGCWWGEIAHCTFCGLNGESMAFRAKSAARVLAEADTLSSRHGAHPLQFADNILSMRYFEDLLPAWAARRDGQYKFFEVKSNLKRRHVKALRDAGIRCVQAGVESLSNTTLRLMKKGVTAAQNVAVLRWCQELGVEGLWNLLFGFPGEDPSEDAATLGLLARMVHMMPPTAVAPIRMDRFSPNYERSREHGFTRVEPVPAYRHVFPFPEEALARLAYYFRYEHPTSESDVARAGPLSAFCERWAEERANGSAGTLSVERRGDAHHLVDTRFTRPRRERRLAALEYSLLLACDAPVTRRGALAAAARRTGATEGRAARALERLLDAAAIAEVGSHLVTLAFLPADRPEVGVAGVSLNVIGG